MTNIVTIGGGTGNFVVLSGLKKYDNLNITAIVPATDAGGSTGRLRDQFGFLPSGDIRQCLVSLMEDPYEQKLLRDLFNYRFDKGEEGLKGHNFGNLFLTALTDLLGDDLSAISAAEDLLNTKGRVLPVTDQDIDLVAEYENGKIVTGEDLIDEPKYPHDNRLKIKKLRVAPETRCLPQVATALNQADKILIAPGDLYTSVLAVLVVSGVSEAIQESNAEVVGVINLMTKLGQTTDFTAKDHVFEVERYLGCKLDRVLINNEPLPQDILKKYARVATYPVKNNLSNDARVVEADLLAKSAVKNKAGDTIFRSLIRHDGDKIAGLVV